MPRSAKIWDFNEVISLFELPLNDLLFKAASIHRQNFDHNEVQLSTLLSIKTGSCPEDCKYCPQSAHYNTGLKKEELMNIEDIENAALKAKDAGASRFCMGAAWRKINDKDLPKLKEIIASVKNKNMEVCVTLGMATKEQLTALKEAGLDYYNHNIDSSEEFYNKVISTRNYQDRLDTLENINACGLKTCCGGIVGMGESKEDRAKMLITLANMPSPPMSVPINKLVKVKGTPLQDEQDISDMDFVRTVAIARIMLPRSYVRLSAGRESMSDIMQAMCFFAGANSIFYGEKLLTTDNNDAEADMKLFQDLGIRSKNLQENDNNIIKIA